MIWDEELLALAAEEARTQEELSAYWAASYQRPMGAKEGMKASEAHSRALHKLQTALFVAVHKGLRESKQLRGVDYELG